MVDRKVLFGVFSVSAIGLTMFALPGVSESYEYFDISSFSQHKFVDEFCDMQEQGEIHCENEKISIVKKRIDRIIGKFFETMKDASPRQQYVYRKEIKKLLPILTKKIIRTNNTERKFGLSYTKFLIKDIIAYFSYQDSLIKVDLDYPDGTTKSISMIRREIIHNLLAEGEGNFVEQPYQSASTSGVYITTNNENWKEYYVNKEISGIDNLDVFLKEYFDKLSENKSENLSEEEKTIAISPEQFKQWGSLYLFKNKEDLEYYGYEVISHRTRTNYDESYRRYNIDTALDTIGSVRVISPGETISFLEGSKFDPYQQERYLFGKVIFLDEERYDYGGGLCGGSTALYQGIVLNKGLEITSRNHTKWFTNLYTATINGEKITTPGLDSTIYHPNLDLKFTNITKRPIILISNYNGKNGGVEEVFTLGEPRYRGSVQFVSSWPRTYTMRKTEEEILQEKQELSKEFVGADGQSEPTQNSTDDSQDIKKIIQTNFQNATPEVSPTKSVVGRCYKRIINGQPVSRCYKRVH